MSGFSLGFFSGHGFLPNRCSQFKLHQRSYIKYWVFGSSFFIETYSKKAETRLQFIGN
ncbi:hypothetical protein Patl1_22317 [Pistacia atlantica]|uniref:Uncharacterized protein n=1 Tax=Pistacia atlantica TaxID=434234 RepID=A0ACC0ZWS3_9ROSI|nr:hypothetical protein Patl1_22317 [Pistacia atlantica]